MSKLELKITVDYARFGRVLKFNKFLFFLQFTFIIGFFEIVFFYFFEEYTKYITYFVKNFFIGEAESYTFLSIKLYYFNTGGRLPTFEETIFFLFLFSVFIFFLFSRFNFFTKPISIWLLYIATVYSVSSFYFLFFAPNFPYTIKDFSFLYMLLQLGVFIVIPIVLGISLSVFSFNLLVILINFFSVALAMLYSAIFFAVKYITFLILLKKFSYIHMPAMFFVFGPLLDFIYISFFYSFAVYLISKLSKRGRQPYLCGF